jgi:hypothetical protein
MLKKNEEFQYIHINQSESKIIEHRREEHDEWHIWVDELSFFMDEEVDLGHNHLLLLLSYQK